MAFNIVVFNDVTSNWPHPSLSSIGVINVKATSVAKYRGNGWQCGVASTSAEGASM